MGKRVLLSITAAGFGVISLQLFIILFGYTFHFADGFKPSNAPKSDIEEIDPTNIDAIYTKGEELYDQGKYEEAIKWFDKALVVDPKYVDALNNKGAALDDLDKYEEAITWYDKALAVDPQYVNALNGKGLALANLGKYEESITWYDKALAVDPNYKYAKNNKKHYQN